MAPGNCTGPGYPVDLWTKCCMVLCRLCRWALQRFDSDWTCNLVVGFRCCSLALLSIHPKSKSSFSTAWDLRWSTTRHQLTAPADPEGEAVRSFWPSWWMTTRPGWLPWWKTGETQLETSVMWKLMALSHGVSSCKRTDKLKEEKTLWPYSHTLQGDMPLTHLSSHVSMFVHVLSSFRVSGRIKFNIPESILSSPFRRFANDLPQASRVFDFGENCEAVHLDDGSRAQREAVELEIAPIFLCWVLLLSCF